jgi:hypothetical protein
MTEVEVDEMSGLCCESALFINRTCSSLTVCNKTTEISSHNAVPGSSLSRIKLRRGEQKEVRNGQGELHLFLDILRNVLANVREEVKVHRSHD